MDEKIYPLTYQLEQGYWWYTGRRAIILSQVAALLKKNAGTGRPRILDYGCGTGINLLHLARWGDAYGLDASEQAIAFCRQRGIDQVAQLHMNLSPGEENPFGQPFDLITLLDVLEHMPDDRQALSGLARLLKPGALLLATVPAYRFLWSGEDTVSHHLRRYRRSQLVRLFRQAGYEVLKASYFNCMLFPAQAAVTLWGRIFQPGFMTSTTLKPLPSHLNAALGAILAAEAGLLRRSTFPVGGSILCIGRLQAP